MQTSEGFVTTADGLRLYYQKVGEGPNVVVVPNGLYLVDEFARLAHGRTIVFYDVRNRGRSDAVEDPAALARGIHQDVDDLDVVRRHFGLEAISVIGHSYIGVMVALYAMRYPAHVTRAIQIGASPPAAAAQYPPELTGADAVLTSVLAQLATLQQQPAGDDPVARCRRFWSILGAIYVADPADAARINWGRCDLANERNFMKYWMGSVQPSLQRLALTPADFARAAMPFLIVHGRRDRSAPYGGALDWAASLPNARLVTVDNAAHAPWIENPDLVFGAINAFLGA